MGRPSQRAEGFIEGKFDCFELSEGKFGGSWLGEVSWSFGCNFEFPSGCAGAAPAFSGSSENVSIGRAALVAYVCAIVWITIGSPPGTPRIIGSGKGESRASAAQPHPVGSG